MHLRGPPAVFQALSIDDKYARAYSMLSHSHHLTWIVDLDKDFMNPRPSTAATPMHARASRQIPLTLRHARSLDLCCCGNGSMINHWQNSPRPPLSISNSSMCDSRLAWYMAASQRKASRSSDRRCAATLAILI